VCPPRAGDRLHGHAQNDLTLGCVAGKVVVPRQFESTSDEARAYFRRQWAHSRFAGCRLYLAIGPEARLADVKAVWPLVQAAQAATYAVRPPKQPRRNRIYEARLRAYDAAVTSSAWAAKFLSQLSRSGLYRRRAEALRDIEGTGSSQVVDLTPKRFVAHTETCPKCRNAQTSDDFCRSTQRSLGMRSGRLKGAVPLKEVDRVRDDS